MATPYIQFQAKGPIEAAFESGERPSPFYPRSGKTHTAFGKSIVSNGVSGGKGVNWGDAKVRVDIPKSSGDALGSMSLKIRLPSLSGTPGIPGNARWVPLVALASIRRATLVAGEIELQTLERQFAYLHFFTTSVRREAKALQVMMGGHKGLPTDREHELHVPLPFLTRKRVHPNQTFLPTAPLASAGSPLYVELEIESLRCLITVQGEPLDAGRTAVLDARSQFLPRPDVELVAEVISLSPVERTMMLRYPTTLFFDSIRDIEAPSFREDEDGSRCALRTISVDLSEINMPVKYFMFVVYSSDNSKTPGKYFQYSAKDIESVRLVINNRGYDEASNIPPEVYRLWVPFRAGDGLKTLAGGDVLMISHSLLPMSNARVGWMDFSTLSDPKLEVKLNHRVSEKMLVGGQGLMVKIYAVCCNKLIISTKGITVALQ